jgi:hypothetical protein
MQKTWFKAAPFVGDQAFGRSLSDADENFVDLCQKVTQHLSLTADLDVGRIVGRAIPDSSPEEGAMFTFDVYMDRFLATRPMREATRTKTAYKPKLCSHLHRRISNDHPGLPVGYSMWKHASVYRPACEDLRWLGTEALSETHKVWTCRTESGLHRAGCIPADFTTMPATGLAKAGANTIDNLAAYIRAATTFADHRAAALKAKQLAAAKAAAAKAASRDGGARGAGMPPPALNRQSTAGPGMPGFSAGGGQFGWPVCFLGRGRAFAGDVDDDGFDGLGQGVGRTTFQRQMFHGSSSELVLASPLSEGLKWGACKGWMP